MESKAAAQASKEHKPWTMSSRFPTDKHRHQAPDIHGGGKFDGKLDLVETEFKGFELM